MSESEKLLALLNKRILFEDQFATVRYVGPVPPTKGDWLGVEWDSVSRGKHDGVHNGIRYFTCSIPNSGSFIRFSSKINTGRSFLSALTEKYIGDNDDASNKTTINEIPYDAQKDLESLYWAGNTKIEVEVLGWEKIRRRQRHLDRLTEVGLSFEQISNAGAPGEIETVCPNIVDLNLSKNLFSDFDTVAQICAQLKRLEVLRLKQLEILEPCLKNLQNLQVGFNNIKHLRDKSTTNSDIENENLEKIKGFDNLKILNLESNIIEDWREIEHLAHLKNLEILYLSGNLIKEIHYNGQNNKMKFANLRSLNVGDNNIQSWRSVDELNKFPALKELRIKKNPFMKDIKPDEANISLVGRIKALTLLNGSIISPGDRVNAERYYLILIVRDLKSAMNEIENQHPRFRELCDIHGTPDPDDSSLRASSSALKDRLLTLTITSRSALDQQPTKKISKKLLGTMTIRNLKNLLQKLFGIPASHQKLFYLAKSQVQSVPGENMASAVEINDDLRQLSYYDIVSGDEIVIISV
ncbi:8592_t:CDS:10 [Ambispora gerdemannii]|uniref:8592_t:CDS:1 n=1 Tax=Ambispora gerdemannii TaxID=144530 RepID=A0A9N8V629_9GLOM|nr:8592_t:CDS:10 [Ambispora gerdemannii]